MNIISKLKPTQKSKIINEINTDWLKFRKFTVKSNLKTNKKNKVNIKLVKSNLKIKDKNNDTNQKYKNNPINKIKS